VITGAATVVLGVSDPPPTLGRRNVRAEMAAVGTGTVGTGAGIIGVGGAGVIGAIGIPGRGVPTIAAAVRREVRGGGITAVVAAGPPGGKVRDGRALKYARLAAGTRFFNVEKDVGGRAEYPGGKTIGEGVLPCSKYLGGQLFIPNKGSK